MIRTVAWLLPVEWGIRGICSLGPAHTVVSLSHALINTVFLTLIFICLSSFRSLQFV